MRRALTNVIARLWGRSFLRHCARAASGRLRDSSVTLAGIRRRQQSLMTVERAIPADHKAVMIRTMCSWVLAAIEALERELNPESAFQIVRGAFARTFAAGIRWQIHLLLWFSRDPVRALSKWSLAAIAQRRYGSSMEFAEEKSAESVDLLVRRCSFHQYFVDRGRPELTPIICAWDRNWMDVFDQSSRPVRTERPTTISTGGNCCRFRFVRDKAKVLSHSSDVIEVELDKRLPSTIDAAVRQHVETSSG